MILDYYLVVPALIVISAVLRNQTRGFYLPYRPISYEIHISVRLNLYPFIVSKLILVLH